MLEKRVGPLAATEGDEERSERGSVTPQPTGAARGPRRLVPPPQVQNRAEKYSIKNLLIFLSLLGLF